MSKVTGKQTPAGRKTDRGPVANPSKRASIAKQAAEKVKDKSAYGKRR